MKEFSRLCKKTIKVIQSRGVEGFLRACKSYFFKNFSILSISKEKTGDVLFVGKIDDRLKEKIEDLSEKGYLCKVVSLRLFDKKYVDLFDVFCFSDEVNSVNNEFFSRIEKYNKIWLLADDIDNMDNHIEKKRRKKITYVSPSTDISGGLMVIAQHLEILQEAGFNVSLISQGIDTDMSWKKDFNVPVLHVSEVHRKKKIDDVCVATFWDTVAFVDSTSCKDKYYLVQNKEHFFYKKNDPFFEKAKKSYENDSVQFLTVSQWCQNWLLNEFGKTSIYIPNCIDVNLFNDSVVALEKKNNKTRILIEGNPENDHKNVDEAFEIIKKLDREKFEIWLVSYGGNPKKWYSYDRVFNKIPHYDMPSVYKSCDILLKTSKIESFSYPPLEMMACGGVCVVAENEGNIEYVKNEYNALTYDLGNINRAVGCVNELADNIGLQQNLKKGAKETVSNREMIILKNILKEIFS